MHYNIYLRVAKKKLLFLLKNYIECGDGDGAGIPEPVGDGDGVYFLIPVRYG